MLKMTPSEYPKADTESRMPDQPFVSELPKLRKIIASRGLTGLSNNAKWDEFINAIRMIPQESWRPAYRCKYIDSDYISEWDIEWWHHLPFPFISVMWFEVSYQEEVSTGRLMPSRLIDHSPQLEELLTRIGMDYEKGGDVIRIFGYAPRDTNGFTNHTVSAKSNR